MTVKNPSYLVKSRHGIWYFQIQIPKKLQKNSKRKLFRKSLKTANRKSALSQARHWWVLMEKNNYEWEQEQAQESADLYSHGKYIYGKLNELDPHDSNELDEFFLELSEYDYKALTSYNDQLLERDDEDSETSKQISVDSETIRCIIAQTLRERTAEKNKPNETLKKLLEKFIIEKRRNWGKKQADSTEHKDYRPKIGLFIEIVGNKSGNQLEKRDTVHYKETMFQLPKNKKKMKKYRDKSISELLEMNIPKSDHLAENTITNNFNKVATFLKWCAINDYSIPNLEHPLHNRKKRKSIPQDDRQIFSENDLQKLFMNGYYERMVFEESNQYWIPLLGLFTGARENELCQLYVDDIQNEGGIWFIDINDNKDKRIKSLYAKRKVPIHSTLINKLHFLDYVEKLKIKGKDRLFPELKNSRDGYGQSFSKWFNRTYRKNIDVGKKEGEKKNFHSFRHTLVNYYKQLGNVDEYRVSELVGHKPETTTITYGLYGKIESLKQRKELVELFKVDCLDFKKIRLWKK